MRELERRVVLSVLDRKWREHLYEMDYLQEGIGLRAMAQRDPLVEYQREGFDMFAAMMDGIKEESVGFLFNVEVQVEAEPPVEAGLDDIEGVDDIPLPGDTLPAVGRAGSLLVAKSLAEPKRPSRLEYSAPSLDTRAVWPTRPSRRVTRWRTFRRTPPGPTVVGRCERPASAAASRA